MEGAVGHRERGGDGARKQVRRLLVETDRQHRDEVGERVALVHQRRQLVGRLLTGGRVDVVAGVGVDQLAQRHGGLEKLRDRPLEEAREQVRRRDVNHHVDGAQHDRPLVSRRLQETSQQHRHQRLGGGADRLQRGYRPVHRAVVAN